MTGFPSEFVILSFICKTPIIFEFLFCRILIQTKYSLLMYILIFIFMLFFSLLRNKHSEAWKIVRRDFKGKKLSHCIFQFQFCYH